MILYGRLRGLHFTWLYFRNNSCDLFFIIPFIFYKGKFSRYKSHRTPQNCIHLHFMYCYYTFPIFPHWYKFDEFQERKTSPLPFLCLFHLRLISLNEIRDFVNRRLVSDTCLDRSLNQNISK